MTAGRDHGSVKGIHLFAMLVWALGWSSAASAQSVTVSGYVEDARTGERLVGATVYEVHQRAGVVTNAHGFFSLTLPPGSLVLRASYVGYRSDTLR